MDSNETKLSNEEIDNLVNLSQKDIHITDEELDEILCRAYKKVYGRDACMECINNDDDEML